MADNSVDSVVTDPPYELGFMNRAWDSSGIAYNIEVWLECLRVLKPGGYLLAFGGTRTYHRMAVAIEDAGFEIRDQLQWLYGSGFPKNHDVQKYVARKVSEQEAQQWEGWGTALKPANEPLVLARKPFSEKTIADNVLKWGTGGLNITGCRIPTEENTERAVGKTAYQKTGNVVSSDGTEARYGTEQTTSGGSAEGRWPANVLLDEDVGLVLDKQVGNPVSRFFYCAKPSKKERNDGLDDSLPTTVDDGRKKPIDNPYQRGKTERRNTHPTVKPQKLMRYLVRLVTPPGGTVLDPFLGSGTTAIACVQEGFSYIGIEREAEYVELATARIQAL